MSARRHELSDFQVVGHRALLHNKPRTVLRADGREAFDGVCWRSAHFSFVIAAWKLVSRNSCHRNSHRRPDHALARHAGKQLARPVANRTVIAALAGIDACCRVAPCVAAG